MYFHEREMAMTMEMGTVREKKQKESLLARGQPSCCSYRHGHGHDHGLVLDPDLGLSRETHLSLGNDLRARESHLFPDLDHHPLGHLLGCVVLFRGCFRCHDLAHGLCCYN
jgi:hypothetical protein